MGSTLEAPLFESYQGKDIISKSLHTSVTEDLLFPIKGDIHKVEPQRITKDQWSRTK